MQIRSITAVPDEGGYQGIFGMAGSADGQTKGWALRPPGTRPEQRVLTMRFLMAMKIVGPILILTAASCGGRTVANGEATEPSPCPRGPFGPDMITVPAPEGTYCIDRTEVPIRAVMSWENAGSFVPAGISFFCEGHSADLYGFWWSVSASPDNTSLPAFGATWCNAEAFCLANGKRLCGAIGGGYLSIEGDPPDGSLGGLEDANESEWYRACTGDGNSSHAYDDEPGHCVQHPEPLEPVGSRAGCEGGYPGLFDMIGNAAEWVGAWTYWVQMPGGTDWTSPYYTAIQGYTSCEGVSFEENLGGSTSIGFRCCADPIDHGDAQ